MFEKSLRAVLMVFLAALTMSAAATAWASAEFEAWPTPGSEAGAKFFSPFAMAAFGNKIRELIDRRNWPEANTVCTS